MGQPQLIRLIGILLTLQIISPHSHAQPSSTDADPSFQVEVLGISDAGLVEVKRRGAATWDKAYVTQKLVVGDRIRTDARARATLRLMDRTVVRVDELSDFEIKLPAEPDAPVLLRVWRGVLYLFHRDAEADVRLESESATAATRGTEFMVTVDGAGAMTLLVLEGEGELSGALNSVRLKAGEEGLARPGQAVQGRGVVEVVEVVEVAQAVQWALYYPWVLDLTELDWNGGVPAELKSSIDACHAGDVLQALASYPPDRAAASDAERIYLAALLLAVGRVAESQALLNQVAAEVGSRHERLARALSRMVEIISKGDLARALDLEADATATEYLVLSYLEQARGRLVAAREAARRAVEVSPAWGWIRLGELEFSFGNVRRARAAMREGLQRHPQYGPGHVLAGFMAAAAGKLKEARAAMERALELDDSQPQAWLGRGLLRIRAGQTGAGRSDLQVAAVLQPRRAVFRSYLAKAMAVEGEWRMARHELEVARALDPEDPTSWLYGALLSEQENRINEGIRELETSVVLNDNRRLYRSRVLLDEDRAVRGANLARLYEDAGMPDWGLREAASAVNADYANYSSHLFLANAYNDMRDPRQVNLRYETAWFSEYLVANLLAPVGAGALSQNVSQEEYARLFQRDRFGVVSHTRYGSGGDWEESATVHGRQGNTAFAVDAFYRDLNGQRPNDDLQQTTWSVQLKHELTPQDGLFFQGVAFHAEGGDLTRYYDPNQANRQVRFEEDQEPLLVAGYHREWGPGHHSLLLASHVRDRFEFSNPTQPELQLFTTNGQIALVPVPALSMTTNRYEADFQAFTAEWQQIWEHEHGSLIVGSRFQDGTLEATQTRLSNMVSSVIINTSGATSSIPPVPSQRIRADTDFDRITAYAYYNWRVADPLLLTAGITYDYLHYPENPRILPISDAEESEDQISPKAGFLWQPHERMRLRGAYARSLGGVSLDQSVRLEPSQVAGFNQAYRSLIPESVAGNNVAPEMDLYGLSFDYRLPTGTYLGAQAEWLESEVDRLAGANELDLTFPPLLLQYAVSGTRQDLDYEETSVTLSLHQLLGEVWSVGVRYRLSRADLEARFKDIPAGSVTGGNLPLKTDQDALLHQLNLLAVFNHPSGLFGMGESVFYSQHNHGYSPELPGDAFWHFNVSAGYRFLQRRAEVSMGVLNLGDQDYRLNPLNLVALPPRERTFVAGFRFYW